MDRFEYLDFFKGIAIFFVVLGHTYMKCMGVQTLFLKFIIDFNMPLWFLLSGFMAYKMCHRDIWISLKKKAVSLILPFITCGSVYALGYGEMHQYLYSEFHAGYWFLLSLFWCWLFLLPFLKLTNYIPDSRYKWGIELLILLIPYWLLAVVGHFVSSKFWIVSTLSMSNSYYRFVVLGFFLGRMIFESDFKKKMLQHYNATAAAITCCFVTIVGAISFLPYHDRWTSVLPMTFIQILLCISVMGVAMFYRSHMHKSRKAIESVGRNSLAIYCFHYFIIYHIHISLDSSWIELTEGVYFFIASFWAVLIIVLTLILAMPFNYNKYLRFIFLGKGVK